MNEPGDNKPNGVKLGRWQFSLRSLLRFVVLSAVFVAVAARLGGEALVVFTAGFLVGRWGYYVARELRATYAIQLLSGIIAALVLVWPSAWFLVFVVEGYPALPIFQQEVEILRLIGVVGGAFCAVLCSMRDLWIRQNHKSS